MESALHAELKRASMAYLASRGCRVMAQEVLCPHGAYRLDVAAYVDREIPGLDEDGGSLFDACELPDGPTAPGEMAWTPSSRVPPATVVVECKAQRSDFLRDTAERDALLRARERLHERLRTFEREFIRDREPQLRRQAGLLGDEHDEWDFGGTRMRAYERVREEIAQLETKLHGGTKFGEMTARRVADRMYIAAPRGLVRVRELPPGWGLLECSGRPARVVRERARARGMGAHERTRTAMLRNIAAAATRPVLAEVLGPWAGAPSVSRGGDRPDIRHSA